MGTVVIYYMEVAYDPGEKQNYIRIRSIETNDCSYSISAEGIWIDTKGQVRFIPWWRVYEIEKED